MDKSSVLLLLGSSKQKLSEKYPISRLGLFGSVSRGEEHKDSDVDLLVEFHQSVGLEFVSLAEDLEKLLGCKVDLVSRNGIKDRYFTEIQKDLIYV